MRNCGVARNFWKSLRVYITIKKVRLQQGSSRICGIFTQETFSLHPRVIADYHLIVTEYNRGEIVRVGRLAVIKYEKKTMEVMNKSSNDFLSTSQEVVEG